MDCSQYIERKKAKFTTKLFKKTVQTTALEYYWLPLRIWKGLCELLHWSVIFHNKRMKANTTVLLTSLVVQISYVGFEKYFCLHFPYFFFVPEIEPSVLYRWAKFWTPKMDFWSANVNRKFSWHKTRLKLFTALIGIIKIIGITFVWE